MKFLNLENGVPTYGYDLAQAVKDGYLVDYHFGGVKAKIHRTGYCHTMNCQKRKRKHMRRLLVDENGSCRSELNHQPSIHGYLMRTQSKKF